MHFMLIRVSKVIRKISTYKFNFCFHHPQNRKNPYFEEKIV